MKAVLVYVPSRSGFGAKTIPHGPLAVANILTDAGVEVRFHDMNATFDEGIFRSVLESFRPDIIGYSGIASSFPKTKEISALVKAHCGGKVVQIAGGPLASTGEYLLSSGLADYVVHGEAELSLPRLIAFLRGEMRLEDIRGISYLKNGSVVRTRPEEQVADLDTVKLPAYHLIDLKQYRNSIRSHVEIYGYSISSNTQLMERLDSFTRKGRDGFIDIVTSRGCTHACLFCYRHVRGVRRHSVGYVIKHIKLLREKYGVGGVAIGDELFNSDEEWVYDFCDAVEREFGEDFFYRIIGARANKVDPRMLNRLRETGCIEISFGHESGSEKILKEYRKGISLGQNIEATLMSKEAGLFSPVQLVIGSPSETTGTILETVRFLKKVNAFHRSTSVNYLIPLPETPIWKYVIENGLIKDVEEYLERVSRYGGMFGLGLNLTKSSNFVWKFWLALIYRRTFLNEALHKKNILLYFFDFFFGRVMAIYVFKRAKKLFGVFKKRS